MEAYQAIVCAQNLPSTDFKDALVTTGLIHLIVVSGSHLILLKEGLQKLLGNCKRALLIILVILFLYCGVCKLEPPVVRAFMALLLSLLNKKFKLFWSPGRVTHLAGLSSLALFPEWLFSKSLLLSWLASLSLIHSKNGLTQSALCYLLLMPILIEFSPLSPWTIAINFFFSSLIGLLLFPLAALSFLISPVHTLTDLMWQGLDCGIELLKNLLQLEKKIWSIKVPIEAHWLFLFVVTHFLERRKTLG